MSLKQIYFPTVVQCNTYKKCMSTWKIVWTSKGKKTLVNAWLKWLRVGSVVTYLRSLKRSVCLLDFFTYLAQLCSFINFFPCRCLLFPFLSFKDMPLRSKWTNVSGYIIILWRWHHISYGNWFMASTFMVTFFTLWIGRKTKKVWFCNVALPLVLKQCSS